MTRSRLKTTGGFTLIEILVVMVIIAVLAALIAPRVINRTDDARVTAARADLATLMQGLKLYRLDNLAYPSQAQGLQSLVEKPTLEPVPANWKKGGYLERLPNDPWGHPYQYENPGKHGEIDVYSFGADGKPGGQGQDADLGSWAL